MAAQRARPILLNERFLVIYMYAKVFSIQIYIPIFQRNSVEGLHFSTFHFYYELIIVNYNYLNYHKLLV